MCARYIFTSNMHFLVAPSQERNDLSGHGIICASVRLVAWLQPLRFFFRFHKFHQISCDILSVALKSQLSCRWKLVRFVKFSQ